MCKLVSDVVRSHSSFTCCKRGYLIVLTCYLQGRNDGVQEGAQFPGRRITMGAPNDCGRRRKVPKTLQILSSIHYLAPERSQVRTWSQACFFPRAPYTPVTPLTRGPHKLLAVACRGERGKRGNGPEQSKQGASKKWN